MKKHDGTDLYLGFVFLFIILLLILISNSEGSVGKQHNNSIGSVMYIENPLMYMAGSLIDSPDAIARIDGNLSLRIHPIGTYMLYDESVLLCGMPLDKFIGVTQPFVITYERVARHSVQGVGCHVLVSADSLKTKETLQ